MTQEIHIVLKIVWIIKLTNDKST